MKRVHRLRVSVLAVFAILFQAVLFGWHHHDLRFAGCLPVPILENPAATPQLAVDEDGCEICQVLHHLTAAPVDVTGALSPVAVAAVSVSGDDAFVTRTPAVAFRARAPPLVRRCHRLTN
jgi:hypothetical protein